ncbi:MAG TPA: PAS domain S-box protein [Vicinamibacterales bacterium]|nr:PAS domain S-box protein [Vicinamibacterales bacterium]
MSLPAAHSLEHLDALTRAIDDAVVSTDTNGTITSWNRGAENLFGYLEADALGQPISVVFPPQRTNEEREIIARVRRGERVHDHDAVRRRRDGSEVSVALTIMPILIDGKAAGTVRVARDISERQLADRAVRRLAAIVQSSDDAIISKDLNGIVTSWNRAAEQLFGYTAEEMIGRSIRTIIPADRQSEEDTVLAAIRRGEKMDHFETIRQRKDGELVPISLTVSPIVDASGRVVGASKVARDISERQRLETDRAQALALAEENATTTEHLNHAGGTVASTLDRHEIVQAVTNTVTLLTGAQFGAFYESAIGQEDASCRITAVSGRPLSAMTELPLARGTPDFEAACRGERVVRVPDAGEAAPARSVLAVPVKSRSGEMLGGLVFGHALPDQFTDRHERLAVGVAAWASIALENARLYVGVQEASRLKDQFIATLSHELRTPLNAILGYARMIRAGIVAPERRERAVATIERNATSLSKIVEDVLDVSRIISGKMRLNVQTVDVADIVHAAVIGMIPAADAKGIRVEEQFDANAAPVSADPERLQQVVWNLISNAVKFTARDGLVRVRLARANGHIEVEVTDTGIGIPRPFLPHVFEAFRQADAGMARERGGLGLGLNITRQLVELHGGTIEASSAGEGKGATFCVRLPVATLADDAARSGDPVDAIAHDPIALPDLHGIRILAVDDDRDALAMVQEILQAAGADVSTAGSGPQALDVIDSVRPDVVVADIGMPRMDGFELIDRIRTNTNAAVRDVPAAALTAYARSEDRARAMRSGYQVHLSKPIDPAELMATVASLAKR